METSTAIIPTTDQAVTAPGLPLEPQECPVTLYLLNDLSTEASRRGMFANLRRAARALSGGQVEDPVLIPWWLLEQRHLARLKGYLLEQGAAPASVNTVLAGVRGVLRQCRRLKLMTAEQLADASDVKPARGERVDRKGRVLSPTEVNAILAVCCDDASPAGVRDAALFGLAIAAGLRREELVTLTTADYRLNAEHGVGELVVRGKGNKERRVYVTNGTAEALADWLEVRGAAPGPLFLPVNKGGRVVMGRAMVGQAVSQLMARRAGQAQVAAFSPHDCRRTFISTLLDNGVDISTAARLAGHANVETTRGYDRRGERAAVEAAGKTLHIPYRRAARA